MVIYCYFNKEMKFVLIFKHAKRFIHRPASTLTTLLSKTSPAPQDLSAPPPASWTTHMRGSVSWRSWRGTKNFSTAPELPMPSRPLLFLYHLARVHQEDCSSDLARSRPLHKNVLSKCTLRTCYPSVHPRTCYPSAHSECAIQVHGILVYYSCTTNLVHLSCTIGSPRTTLVHCSCAPLTSFLNCRGTSRCLAVGTSTRVPSCTTP